MKAEAFFRRLGFKQNLFLLLGAVSLMYLVVGVMSLQSLMEFGRRYEELKNTNILATTVLHEIDNAFLKLRLSSANFSVGHRTPPPQTAALEAQLKKKIDDGILKFAPMADTPTEIELLKKWRILYTEFLSLRARQMQLLADGREKEFDDFRIQVSIPMNKKAEKTLDDLIAFQAVEAGQKELAVADDLKQSELIIIVLLISSGVLGAFIVWLSVNWISRETQHRLEALNKSATLGAIAGDIAHEINNPLAVITASADLLTMMGERGAIDPVRGARLIDKIRLGADRIQKVTSGMRAFARDGSVDPFVDFPVRRMLEETLAFCNEKIKRHSVAFYFEAPPEDFELQGRAAEISQVIVNLLANSVDAISEKNDRWLRLTLKDLGDKVEISIVDSGLGISEAIRDKMFKTSFTTKEVGAGTGLGLGICARIIGTHHGTIEVDPTCENTRIVVTLPKLQHLVEELKVG